jgi:hypothetical protein
MQLGKKPLDLEFGAWSDVNNGSIARISRKEVGVVIPRTILKGKRNTAQNKHPTS